MLRGIVATPKPRGPEAPAGFRCSINPRLSAEEPNTATTRLLDNYPIFRYMVLVLAREGRLRRRSEAERVGR